MTFLSSPFHIEPLQPMPGSFSGALDSQIFRIAQASTCPFFNSPEFSHLLVKDDGITPGIIITGQQPGFMGGPLYTIYKIATAIALATQRSERGQPTIPIFWVGDDDDDVMEALSTTAWDPARDQFFNGTFPENYTRPRILAEIPARGVSMPALTWLESLANVQHPNIYTEKLKSLYSTAEQEDWGFSKLFSTCISMIFSGSGLVVVHGNDPLLHKVARPFYEKIIPELPLFQELLLKEKGNAISERSINNPLFKANGIMRQRLNTIPKKWDQSLRPGVLLRSMVQDWLFNPVAVVVGPGELAYLNQLKPLYEKMQLVRSPLVPRLFGWLAPQEVAGNQIKMVSEVGNGQPADYQNWSNIIKEVLESNMVKLLLENSGLNPGLASSLGSKKALKMTRNLPDFFETMDRYSKGSYLQNMPPWIFPQGYKQERKLASFNSLALWGKPLMDAIGRAAKLHLQLGTKGQWQELLITVPSPDNLYMRESGSDE